MAGLIPENIINQILDRADIVEVISGYIPLKRAGRNFKALCPFHHEKTGSFMVNPDKQIYHCFGCGVGGNVFNFIMRQEKMEFPEAVEMLSKKTGIVIPRQEPKNSLSANLSQQLYKINEAACNLYHETLCELSQAKAALEYLKRRKIDSAAIKKFKIGFALDKWDNLLNYLRSKDFSLNLLDKAGLIISKEERDGFYDRFRNRIIFPIFDIKNRIIAFGARLLEVADVAKYVNSPETPIYVKGNNLYGLNFSKDYIREKDFAVIVEGYLDFITPFQAGLDNIVASLGTALTIEQIRILKRYSHNVVMLYDADSAGQLATLRSLDILLEEAMNVKVANLPSGYDPDSFVNKFGLDALKEKIKQANNLFDYKINLLMSQFSHKEAEGKAKIASEMLPTINKVPNAVLRYSYLKKLSEALSVNEEALLIELKKINKYTASYFPKESKEASSLPLQSFSATEKMILKLLFAENRFIEQFKDRLDVSNFEGTPIKDIIAALCDCVSQGKDIVPSKLISYFDGRVSASTISELCYLDDLASLDTEKVLDECLNRLKKEKLKSKCRKLHEEIGLAEKDGDTKKAYQLAEKYNQLIKG